MIAKGRLKQFGKRWAKYVALILVVTIVANYFGLFLGPETAHAANANMMLFWDGGAAPSGWSFVDDGAGEAFYNDGTNNLFPRGNSTFGRMAGGAATHTHTATPTSPSSGQNGGTSRKGGTTAGTTSQSGHTHAVSGTASLTAVSNLPAYRNLRVIQYSGIPTTIPNGAIAIFDSAVADQMPNADWNSYSATQSTNYVSGYSSSGGSGGSNTHAGAGHTVSGLTLSQETSKSSPGGSTAGAVSNHTHVACSTNNVTNAPASEPPYVNVLLGKTNKDTAIPAGMIAMFDSATFGSFGWEILSGAGGPFYQKFLKSATAYSAGAGADPTHSHTSVTCTSDGKSGTANYGSGTNGYELSGTHTHTTSVAIDVATGTTLPPYTDVVIAKHSYAFTTLSTDKGSYPTSGETITISSQVDNYSSTNLTNTKIDYVAFIDGNANNAPDAGETYVTSNCAGSGSWAANSYTFQTTALAVNAGSNATDSKNCANTNFPSNTTYVLWSKWYDNGNTITYDTNYFTFTSVPTLTEMLFFFLVGSTVFIGVRSGVIKMKKDKEKID